MTRGYCVGHHRNISMVGPSSIGQHSSVSQVRLRCTPNGVEPGTSEGAHHKSKKWKLTGQANKLLNRVRSCSPTLANIFIITWKSKCHFRILILLWIPCWLKCDSTERDSSWSSLRDTCETVNIPAYTFKLQGMTALKSPYTTNIIINGSLLDTFELI
jgi:hypothetical protein